MRNFLARKGTFTFFPQIKFYKKKKIVCVSVPGTNRCLWTQRSWCLCVMEFATKLHINSHKDWISSSTPYQVFCFPVVFLCLSCLFLDGFHVLKFAFFLLCLLGVGRVFSFLCTTAASTGCHGTSRTPWLAPPVTVSKLGKSVWTYIYHNNSA